MSNRSKRLTLPIDIHSFIPTLSILRLSSHMVRSLYPNTKSSGSPLSGEPLLDECYILADMNLLIEADYPVHYHSSLFLGHLGLRQEVAAARALDDSGSPQLLNSA